MAIFSIGTCFYFPYPIESICIALQLLSEVTINPCHFRGSLMIQTHQFTIGWRIYKSRRKLNRVSQNLLENRTGLNAQQLFASNSAFAAITDEVIFFSGWDFGVGGNAVPMPFSVYMDVEPKIGGFYPQNGWWKSINGKILLKWMIWG